jgi:hypothetical protein
VAAALAFETGLVKLIIFGYLFGVSTVSEIEAAIQRLSPAEQVRLRDWLLKRPLPAAGMEPKTGGELAVIWPTLFHLTLQEADEMARDLETDRRSQNPPKPASCLALSVSR